MAQSKEAVHKPARQRRTVTTRRGGTVVMNEAGEVTEIDGKPVDRENEEQARYIEQLKQENAANR
jgi:hypothetical protein